MLKLRKVEIIGFKSFCERTVVTFSGTGTTCIVGPNGCGKSNVVDAISWVLGEQSHKSLRAERMADCIFNGTIKRPPMGLAEVTITMEDPELAEAARFVLEGAAAAAGSPTDGDGFVGERRRIKSSERHGSADTTEILRSMPRRLRITLRRPPARRRSEVAAETVPESEFLKGKRRKKSADKPVLATKPGEVVVSRRLYRSGQSEYLINGRMARLRDIQEMFMGVGLGPDSYAIIEQGRIGLILSTKPLERRAIIEEAAGVTKFKTKKRLAEAKLESSKVNLSRVNDIVVEVEKQLGSLKRQAAKARRYSEIRDQMRGIVRQMLAGKARELDAEAERVAKRLEELSAAEAQHAQSIQTQESEQDLLNQRIYELDADIRQNQNHLNLTALEVDRSENRIAFNRQRAEELAGRGGQIAAEITQAAAQAAEWESRNFCARRDRGFAARRIDHPHRASERLGCAGRNPRHADSRIRSAYRSAAPMRVRSGAKLAALTRRAEASGRSAGASGGSAAKVGDQRSTLLESSIQIRDNAERAAFDWEAANAQHSALQQQAASLQTHIAGLREQREAAAKEAETLRDSLSATRARHSTLTQVLNDRSYTADAVQKLFAANERGGGHDFHAVGVLADYAEVEEHHEAAIEQYLRDELEYVVVETFDHARAGVSLLRDEVGGRATFFVDSLRNLRLDDVRTDHALPRG